MREAFNTFMTAFWSTCILTSQTKKREVEGQVKNLFSASCLTVNCLAKGHIFNLLILGKDESGKKIWNCLRSNL